MEPGQAQARQTGKLDRIEREQDAFRSAVEEAYRGLAAIFPQRIVSLDGTAEPDAIAVEVRGHLGLS